MVKNWLWEEMDPEQRQNKILCPTVTVPVKMPPSTAHPEGATNPYQKPLPLYWELLHRFTDYGSLVVELTGGSGTLALACALRFPDRSGT